jgi:hypothetical protein
VGVFIKAILIIIFLISSLTILSCSEESSVQPEPVPEEPEVNIISPEDSSFIGELINIIVSATDNKGIEKVEIYIDNETNNLRTLSTEPYEYLWDTSNEPINSTHSIYAKAYDGDDNVSSSKIITVTKVTTVTPTNFSAGLIGDSAAVFTWELNDPTELTFVLEESINNNEFKEKFETQAGVLTFTLKQPFYVDFIYMFRVRSNKNGILSNPSDMDTITVLFPKPTDFRVVRIGSTNLKLKWIDNSDFESGYLIEKSENSGALLPLTSLPPNSNNYTDDLFNESITNTYTVRAFSNHNESDSAKIIISEPPIISNAIVEPDTVIADTAIIILTTVEAIDPNGNSDIEKVYFNTYKPDGTTNGVETYLYDDGNLETGDVIAGDGVYSRLIQVNETNTKGTYRFQFQAENKARSLSNIINHYVLIL